MNSTVMAWLHQLGTLEFWQNLLEGFGNLGPIAPIFLAMVESFFPPLPLIAIVALNVAAHGGFLGFVYSWIGVILGGTIMFLLWRRVAKRFFWKIASRSQKLEKAISELKQANNSLQQDIEQKEKMEQMRTEFMGNVSHELKTPIALIQGYAEGLKEGVNDDPESRDFYCDVIMDEAGKMNRMVKNLMTLNQLEFGNDKVEFERFNLTELIGGVLQSMDILSQQKDVQLIFREKNPVYVWGDEFKIEQVVRNYVSNAYNHVNEEKIIEVKILQEDGLAKVTVFNTGKPIPEEDVPRIWDKFYKVDKAHTREYGGNGIGLSIVKAIMESMHQQYGVKNYDNGVEFWFTLDVR